MPDTTIIVDPRSFQFFGRKWTEATVMGRDEAANFAAYLVREGVEFHHEPSTEVKGPVHRFAVAAAPDTVEQAFERSLGMGGEATLPTARERESAPD